MQDVKDPSGMPDQSASGEGQEPSTIESSGQKDSVSYDSHRKLLAEKKRLANDNKSNLEKMQELQDKIQDYELSQMESEGKKDEALAQLRKENMELKKQWQEDKQTNAYRHVSLQVASEAAKAGCVDPETFIKNFDFNRVDISDDYQVDVESLKMAIEESKSKMPYFFQKAGPKAVDGVPANSAPGVKSLGQMNIDELKKVLEQKRGL